MEMNLIINKHVRGIALPMALGFSILFMLLTLTMFDFIRLSANQSNEIREKAKIQKQIEFVKDRILDDTRSDSTWLNRYYVFNKRDTIHAVSWPWGGFTCITLTPDGNASDLKSSFLLCHERNDNAGIIYGDEDLRISGKVKIQGKVQVKGSVIRSRIEQEIFSGDVVNAWFHEHVKELPYEAGFTVYTPEAESIPYRKYMQLKNSFGNETKRTWSETNASLASCMFSGNIIIQSENDLIIDSTSYLEDVILRARRIKIENGFKGSVQCYATESISIGENCHLSFPSGIYASGDFIKVGDYSTVNGIIVFSRFINNGYESIINSVNYDNSCLTIGNHGILKGMIICNGTMINYGLIKGTYLVKSGTSVRGSTSYENYLADGSFDSSGSSMILDLHGSIGKLLTSGTVRRIAKWLG